MHLCRQGKQLKIVENEIEICTDDVEARPGLREPSKERVLTFFGVGFGILPLGHGLVNPAVLVFSYAASS